MAQWHYNQPIATEVLVMHRLHLEAISTIVRWQLASEKAKGYAPLPMNRDEFWITRRYL